jgi:phosphohistidine phosphatase
MDNQYPLINKNMYLYLIRHGIAVDPEPLVIDSNSLPVAIAMANDESRALTQLGRKKIAQVADRLGKLGLTFDLIMTSPLVRARQTADIAIDKQISSRLEVSENLKPNGNLQSWLTNWHARSDRTSISTIALIGHEPNLSEWAELFLFGKVYHHLMLKKGGIIGLKFVDNKLAIGTAQLYCLIPPKIII